MLRDWRSLFLSLAIPVILIILFGYALTLDLCHVPTVVWDQSKTPQSRELMDLFAVLPIFLLMDTFPPTGNCSFRWSRERPCVALVIPADFADRLAAGKKSAVQILCDGSDANTSRLAMNYATAIGMIYSTSVTARQMELKGKTGFEQPVELISRSWYNQEPSKPKCDCSGNHRHRHGGHRLHAHLRHHCQGMGDRHHGAAHINAPEGTLN